MKNMLIRIPVCCILVLTLLVTSCGGKQTDEKEPGTAESGDQSWSYEEVDCKFNVPAGMNVECGCLTVPEKHDDPDGDTIDIHVAVFRTDYHDPEPDPIVYLAGGPGEHALEAASLLFEKRFSPLMANRDLIIFDQRGTGYSEPRLYCQELIDLAYEVLDQDMDDEELADIEAAALRNCYEGFIADGIDLSAYTSAESAADLEALRRVLGYEEWNLLGVSYGTRLALTAMRDYPEGIRSVILNSTYPVQENVYTKVAANFDRSLSVLFNDCSEDPLADRTYPALENALSDVITGLDSSPALFQIIHPLTGEAWDVLMDGSDFFSFIVEALYSTESISLIPKIIYDVKEGKYDTLALLMGSSLVNLELLSLGMHYSIQCNEELPFTSAEEVTASMEAYPDISEYFGEDDNRELFELCEYWTTSEPDPVENEPVSSAIPTLVLAGEYDPITPPSWGMLAAETLENSYYYEFTGLGHDTLFSGDECVLGVFLSFLDDPGVPPDSSCSSALQAPSFTVLDVEMVPFTSVLFGFEGLSPAGWVEIAPGTCTRSSLGFTALVQQAVQGMDAETLVGMLGGLVGLSESPEKRSSRSANGLEWSLYREEVQGVIADMAIAENEGISYFIMFTCIGDDHAYYYPEVFLKAVDAVAPSK